MYDRGGLYGTPMAQWSLRRPRTVQMTVAIYGILFTISLQTILTAVDGIRIPIANVVVHQTHILSSAMLACAILLMACLHWQFDAILPLANTRSSIRTRDWKEI